MNETRSVLVQTKTHGARSWSPDRPSHHPTRLAITRNNHHTRLVPPSLTGHVQTKATTLQATVKSRPPNGLPVHNIRQGDQTVSSNKKEHRWHTVLQKPMGMHQEAGQRVLQVSKPREASQGGGCQCKVVHQCHHAETQKVFPAGVHPKRVKRGCPLGWLKTDPEGTDDEYYDRCITVYRNKPAGYEATVKKEIGKEKAKHNHKKATPRQADSQESDLSDGDAQSISSSAALSSQTSSGSTTESGSRQVVVLETSSSETDSDPTQESPQRNIANQTTPPTNEDNHTAKHSGLSKASQSSSSQSRNLN